MELPAPLTVEALGTMGWQDFERLVAEILALYYRPHGLRLEKTKWTRDRGRDAEGVFILGPSDERFDPLQLRIELKLWVEAKQRHGSNIGRDDLSAHLVAAVNGRVSKIVFVTNVEYTLEARQDIEEFCERVGLPHSLINGQQFVQLAQGLITRDTQAERGKLVVFAPEELSLQFRIAMARDVHRTGFTPSSLPIYIDIGEPFLLLIDGTVETGATSNVDFTVSCAGKATVQPFDRPRDVLLSSGDRFRSVFVAWPTKAGRIAADDFVLTAVEKARVTVEVIGSVEVIPSVLADWLPPSRRETLLSLTQHIQRWMDLRDARTTVIIAAAGTGKTHIATALRRQWLAGRAREIYLNGEYERTDVLVVRRIVEHLVPLPPGLLRQQEESVIAEWLVNAGMSRAIAQRLANALCFTKEVPPADLPVAALGEIVAALLNQAAERAPTVVLFEDLHKCLPAVMELMTTVARNLEQFGRRGVLLLYTTREQALIEDRKERRLWLQRLSELSMSSQLVELHPFSRSEALALIARTIPTLAERDAAAILQQVGTTPFGIREAIAFMRDAGIVEDHPQVGWHVPEPTRLRRRIESAAFQQCTYHRLRALRESSDHWLGEILDLGACLGRAFSVTTVAPCSSAPEATDAYDAIDKAIRLNVLRWSTRGRDIVEFDHDLIRITVLEHMSAQRVTAGKLYSRLRSNADHSLLALLAYQAGLAEQCLSHAEENATTQRATRRYLDYAASLQLALLVTDENAYQGRTPREWRELPWVDEALLVATPVHIDLAPSVREARVLDLLRQLIGALMVVSSGSSESVERALNEALMIATRRRDDAQRAFLHSQYGHLLCERDQLLQSSQQHRQAEEIYGSLADPRLRSERAHNLVRLAIVERDLGALEAARQTLHAALAQRGRAEWSFLGEIISNLGGSYFYVDWKQVRRHWEHCLAMTKRRHLPEDEVAAAVDVAYLDVLENRLPEAEEKLLRAERLAVELNFENDLLRVHLNMACLLMVRGDLVAAEERLLAAERIGMAHSIWRRLWRIRANLATIYERSGEPERAFVLDKGATQALLMSYTVAEDRSILTTLARRRTALAFANVALRAAESTLWQPLLEQLPQEVRTMAESMRAAVERGALQEIPFLLGRHCRAIRDAPRFIITE